MNPSSSHSCNNSGKQPQHSSESVQYTPGTSLALYPLNEQAEAAKAKIECTLSQLPLLSAPAEEYLTQKMANVTRSYFKRIANEDQMDARKQIEEAISGMDAFSNDVGNRMRADNTSRSREFMEPRPRPPVTSLS